MMGGESSILYQTFAAILIFKNRGGFFMVELV